MAEEKEQCFTIVIPQRRQFCNASPPQDSLNTGRIRETNLVYQYKRTEEPKSFKLLDNENTLLVQKLLIKNEKISNKKHYCKYEKSLKRNKDVKTGIYDAGPIKTSHSHIKTFKSFKIEINNVLRLKHTIGMKYDCILNIEKKIRDENEIYDKAVEKCKAQASYLRKFVSQDYKNSVNMLNTSEELNLKLDNQLAELYALANKQYAITSKIIGLYYKYRLQQMYGRFLYYLSPPTWRVAHRDFARSVEIENMGFSLGHEEDKDGFHELYEIIRHELRDYIVKPVLYFKEPEDLVKIFSGIENHYGYDFTQLMLITEFIRKLQSSINILKHSIAAQCSDVLNTVNEFKTAVEFVGSRCLDLESRFYNILNGTFYKVVGSKEVLQFNLHLKYCFEKVSEEDSDDRGIVSMAKFLENIYMSYNKYLDNMHDCTVKDIVTQCMKSDKIIIRNAIKANRELRRAKRMEHSLYRAMMPRGHYVTIHTARKISSHYTDAGKERTKSKIIEKTPSITNEQLEYLKLFTNWTEDENPEIYLNSLK